MIVLDWGLTTTQEHKDVSKFCDSISIESLFYKKMLNLLQISLLKKKIQFVMTINVIGLILTT